MIGVTRWLPVILEGVRRALPWILERLKGNGADTLPAVRDVQDRLRRIEAGQDQIRAEYSLQERYLAELIQEVAELRKRRDAK